MRWPRCYDTRRQQMVRNELVHGLQFPWNARPQKIAPLNGWPDLSGRAMAAYVKEYVKHTQFSVRSFRVGCVATHINVGKSCGGYGVREREGQDVERRYVKDAKTTSEHTGTTPGAEEARFVVAYARVYSADLAVWANGLTRPTYPRSLPTPECMHRFTPAVSTSIRASWRLQAFRPTVG